MAAAAAILDPALSVCLLPRSDCLPFDRVSPSRAVMGVRMASLLRLLGGGDACWWRRSTRWCSACPPRTASRRCAWPLATTRRWKALAARLDAMGYALDEQADVPGEVAFRGAVVDIYPADARCRRGCAWRTGASPKSTFTTRSPNAGVRRLDALAVSPASELVFDAPGDRPPGLEHFLPERLAHLVSVFDLLPAAAMLLDPGADELLADRFAQIAEARQTRLALRGDVGPDLPPASLYLTEAEWEAACAGRGVVRLKERAGEALPNFAAASEPAEACVAFVTAQVQEGQRVGSRRAPPCPCHDRSAGAHPRRLHRLARIAGGGRGHRGHPARTAGRRVCRRYGRGDRERQCVRPGGGRGWR